MMVYENCGLESYCFRFLIKRATMPRQRIPSPSRRPDEPASGTLGGDEANTTVMKEDMGMILSGS